MNLKLDRENQFEVMHDLNKLLRGNFGVIRELKDLKLINKHVDPIAVLSQLWDNAVKFLG